MPHGDRADPIAVHIGSNRPIGLEHRQPVGADIGHKHAFHHRKAHARLGADAADPAATRIEVTPGAGAFRQRIMVAVILAHAVA
ncbi:hypothetical protein D3C87_1767070 [compost metagenome]